MGAKLISLLCKMCPSGLQDGTELSSPVPFHGCCCQIPSKGHTSAMQNGLSRSQLPCPREEIPSQFPIRDEGKWPRCTLKGKTPCCKWSQWSWEEYPGVSQHELHYQRYLNRPMQVLIHKDIKIQIWSQRWDQVKYSSKLHSYSHMEAPKQIGLGLKRELGWLTMCPEWLAFRKEVNSEGAGRIPSLCMWGRDPKPIPKVGGL